MHRIAVAICTLVLAALILLPGPRVADAQLATTPWPMFQHDLRHTGLSTANTSATSATEKWLFQIRTVA